MFGLSPTRIYYEEDIALLDEIANERLFVHLANKSNEARMEMTEAEWNWLVKVVDASREIDL